VKAEFSHGGIKSRFGRRRVDVKHLWVDPVIVAGPWVLAGFVLSRLLKRRK
jgi:hypothetical protein